MVTKSRFGLLAVVMAASCVASVNATELLIYHSWSTPSEIAALKVLNEKFSAEGNSWKDLAIAHDSGVNVSLMNMLTGGNPPDVFMNSDPGIYRDLKKQGLAQPLTKLYQDNHILEHLPPAVLKNISVDGEIMKAPVGVHIDGMVYYNKHVADAVGVDPKAWKSLDDLWAVFDKIKAAGYIPIAQGGDKFQIAYLLQAIVASETGNAIYDRFYGEKPDRTCIDTPEMRQALTAFRKIQQHTDPGSPNRKWNETTNLVITGKALLQIHGDWMKGEFLAAGKKPGVDFDCMNIPGTKGVVVTVDAWGFLNTKNPDKAKAQEQFALLVVDPAISAAFAAKKGCSPVRTDVDPNSLDPCNKVVLETLKDPSMQHSNPFNTADADWYRTIWDVADKFWNTPTMTPDQGVAEFQKAYDSVF
jgi:glucose/mannose transport system substrate-binding protein